MLSKKKQTVSKSEIIEFNLCQGKNENASLFLKYTKESGYEINVLGKNAEPKKKVVLNLKFIHRYYKQHISA